MSSLFFLFFLRVNVKFNGEKWMRAAKGLIDIENLSITVDLRENLS